MRSLPCWRSAAIALNPDDNISKAEADAKQEFNAEDHAAPVGAQKRRSEGGPSDCQPSKRAALLSPVKAAAKTPRKHASAHKPASQTTMNSFFAKKT